jgi:hypothetical protein
MTGMENADPRFPGSEGCGRELPVKNDESMPADALMIVSESSGTEEV